MLEEMGGKSWCPPRLRSPFPVDTLPTVCSNGREGSRYLPGFGVFVAGCPGSLRANLLIRNHPDAELALQGSPFPRERLLEQRLWGCVWSAAARGRVKDNPESFIMRMGPLEWAPGLTENARRGAEDRCSSLLLATTPRTAAADPPRAWGMTSPGCFQPPTFCSPTDRAGHSSSSPGHGQGEEIFAFPLGYWPEPARGLLGAGCCENAAYAAAVPPALPRAAKRSGWFGARGQLLPESPRT
ncbi:uncharacterized protein ACIBXB_020748 [Morphnus guianensis]